MQQLSPPSPHRSAASIPDGHARRSRVLMIAYHFHPSSSIGSRRCTALAHQLVADEHKLVVVSSFDGAAPPRTSLPTLTPVLVREPARHAVDFLIWCKRAMRSALGGLRGAAPAEHARPHDPSAREPQDSHTLTDRLFDLLYFVDRHKRWAWRAARASRRIVKEHEIGALLCSGPPWTSLVAAWWVATRSKLPLIVDLRDPWTDWPSWESARLSIGRRITRKLETLVLRRSAAVIVTAPNLARRLSARHPELAPKVHVVMNGFDEPVRVRSTATGHRLAMLFAGELYLNRDPSSLLVALEELLHEPHVDPTRISLTFVGQCDVRRAQRISDWLKGKRCEAIVHMLPQVPASKIVEMTEASSLLLNLAQHSPATVPAKTFEQLTQSREILVLCEPEGDTARLVEGIRGVTRVDPDDVRGLRAVLSDLYARHVIGGILIPPDPIEIAPYSRAVQNARFSAILESVCAR